MAKIDPFSKDKKSENIYIPIPAATAASGLVSSPCSSVHSQISAPLELVPEGQTNAEELNEQMVSVRCYVVRMC